MQQLQATLENPCSEWLLSRAPCAWLAEDPWSQAGDDQSLQLQTPAGGRRGHQKLQEG